MLSLPQGVRIHVPPRDSAFAVSLLFYTLKAVEIEVKNTPIVEFADDTGLTGTYN